MRRAILAAVAATAPACLLQFDEEALRSTPDCGQDGVLRCYDFEDEEDLLLRLGEGLADDSCEDPNCWRWDTEVVGSGRASLRLDTAAGSGGPPVLPLNFTDDFQAIGEGGQFFVQWKQRFNAGMMHPFAGTDGFEFANGWIQLQVTNPDGPEFIEDMCGEVELVIGQDAGFHGPVIQHSCGAFISLERPIETDVLIQTGEDARCLWSGGSPSAPPCFAYPVDEWTTYQLQVSVGHWNEPDSVVRFWAARPGQDRLMIFDNDDVAFVGDGNVGFGKLWLGPVNFRRDSSEDHALATTWYDDVVVSTEALPDP